MKKKYLILFLISVVFANFSDVKANLTAYFYIINPSCNSCCISATEILSNDLVNLNIKNINIVLTDQTKKFKILFSKNKLINNIQIIDEKQLNQYNFSPSGMDLVLKDSAGNIMYYFPQFTNTIQPTNTIMYFNKNVQYSLKDTNLFITNVLSPNIISNNLFFIVPEESIINRYSLKNKKLNIFFDASKQTKFFYFDSLKHRKDIWDMTYEKYKSFIKYYFVFSDSHNLFSLINILSGYRYDSTKKEVLWESKLAILQLDSTERIISLSQEDANIHLLSRYTRLYTFVNDSIILIPTMNKENIAQFSFFNTYSKSFMNMNIRTDDLNSLALDSLLFVADNNNNILFYDYQSDKALYLQLAQDNSLKKSVTKKIKHTVDTPVYDIMAFNNKLYFLFYRPELNNQLYVEEFQIPDFVMIKAFSLQNNKAFMANNIPVKVENNKIFILSSDNDSNWLLEEFSLFEE